RGDYPAIAVDKANVVYAAYQDSLQENRITVKRYNNTSSVWETLGSEGFSPSSAAFISITVDENNNPVVMYRDGSKSGRLTAKRENSHTKGWETIGAEGISSGMLRYTAALQHNSQLFAVYLDENAGYRVGVKQLSSSGSAWNSFGKTGITSGYTAEYTTITVDHENVPYVIYRDGKENNAATVKKYNSDAGDWEVLGRPGLSAGPASYTVIASGKKGEIYTAYADVSLKHRLIVKKYNPNAPFWEDFGGSVVSGAAAKYISLKVGNDNIPCLAFQDEWNYNRITVKRYNPKSRLWTALGPEGFSDGEAGYTNLAIGAGNRVYAAYRDEANGGKATVKVYNSAAAKWETLGHEGFSSGPASYVSIAVDSSNKVYAV